MTSPPSGLHLKLVYFSATSEGIQVTVSTTLENRNGGTMFRSQTVFKFKMMGDFRNKKSVRSQTSAFVSITSYERRQLSQIPAKFIAGIS
jgi:hypothetical protein